MLRSSLSDQNDAYILFRGKITFTAEGYDTAGRQIDERNKEARFKNCAPFTDSISQINYAEVDNAKDLDVVMPMCNLIEQEYNDNHSKSSGILWQYYRDEPAFANNSSANIKLSKTRLSKIAQPGGILPFVLQHQRIH